MPNLILLNKPFKVLSQFSDNQGRKTLKSYLPDSPGFHPAGRLDYDSEGLLILTNDGALQHQIASPKFKLPKTYWVQVEGNIHADQIRQLSQGVELKDGITRPAKVSFIDEPNLWPRNPPIRHRENIPTNWLEITITEGRNRQVRRMTASVGLPTLRLVRFRIGHWSLEDLLPGEHKSLTIHLSTPESDRPSKRPSNKTRKSKAKKHHF